MSVMEYILNELGFERFAGDVWKHPESNIFISVTQDMEPKDLPGKLLRLGSLEQNALIRATLGIKEQ